MSFFIISVVFGYRLVITKQHFKLHYTFLFIPCYGFKCKMEHVQFEKLKDDDSHTSVSIYMEDDPWAQMSFANWVQINYKGKKFDIGDNENYAELYHKIKEAVEKHKH